MNIHAMKRIFFLLSTLLLGIGALSAQDVIVTSAANRINAVIIEIGETDISYKLFDNQEGRLYTISKDDVVTVLMSNGKVLVFGKPADTVEEAHIAQRYLVLPGAITKKDGIYYLNMVGCVDKMSEDAYLRFIAQNCPEAWNAYQKADHLWSLGWRFFGSGVAGLALGLPVWGAGVALENKAAANEPNAYYGRGMKYTGIIMAAAGAALTVVSIPMLSVGQHRRQHAYEVYNACYLEQHHTMPATEPNISLDFRMSPTGGGIALRF